MSRAYSGAAREGCLILISRCPIELARFEGITQRWSVISVLLGSVAPNDLVAMIAGHGNTIIAALEKEASEFVLALHDDVIQSVAGICLVGEEIDMLYGAILNQYQGDMVLLANLGTTPGMLAKTRRRSKNG